MFNQVSSSFQSDQVLLPVRCLVLDQGDRSEVLRVWRCGDGDEEELELNVWGGQEAGGGVKVWSH